MIPEYNFKEWLIETEIAINQKLVDSKRVFVCIAGASASGKSEAASHLKRKLEEAGKKVCLLGTDDYYKGASRIMVEQRIPADAVDFDALSAVDFDELEKAVAALKRGEKITVPRYSMYLSETEPDGGRALNGGSADVIILEGIWALENCLIKYADWKVFVEADHRTLFVRRFRRDVLNSRSSHSPEFTLKILLERVLPAYQKYILPARAKADAILANHYTELETFEAGQYDVQDKIPLSEDEAQKFKTQLGASRAVFFQEDYYFSNEGASYDPRYLLRLRVENGRLKSLAHKGTKLKRADGKIIRPSEHFIKKGGFGQWYKDAEELAASFKKGGFRVEARFSKIREIFQSGEVAVALDKIEGLGIFLELSAKDKLSRAPEIDEFKRRFKLENRQSVGPYVDEYLKKLAFDAEAVKKSEDILNAGATRELILQDNLCATLENDGDVKKAMDIMRRGYPDMPESRQCFGREFREAAGVVLDAISKKTHDQITDKNNLVVLLPWRSGLAFGESYRVLGISRFYHLSSKRNEETLETEVDYENGAVKEGDVVVIADPMLATGNTVVDAISRVRNKGVSEENIILNTVMAAPSGVARVKKDYPTVKIIVGVLDEKLDHRGYIVPGLGDFGDKYFSEMPNEELRILISGFALDKTGRNKMLKRISRQAVSETLNSLLERDLKDMEIDRENRAKLELEGLALCSSKKTIKIDTGRVGGIENVVNLIAGEAGPDDKIITLEGASGVGKTSTAERLAEKLGAVKLSFGEVFRYLTYLALKENGSGDGLFREAIGRLFYSVKDDSVELMDEQKNISVFLADELRSAEVERKLPEIAGRTQALVIGFLQKNLESLRADSDRKILIEGRAFSLDFLPCDLRVKLIADPSIRADRRWAQSG